MSFKNPFEPGGWFHQQGVRFKAMRTRMEASKRRNALHKKVVSLIGKQSDPRAAQLAVDLYELWGDPLDQARESYVRSCLKEFESAEGHVLVSSASLMTLILGAVSANDRGRNVWCLEQDPHWTNVIRSWLAQYAIKGTYVISAPPTVRGGMVRYRVDTKHLPKNIGLILCDGSSATPGSALSTLLSIGPHLAPEFTVFARKIRVDEDGPLLKRWAMKNDATFVVVNNRDGFVKISRRDGAKQHSGGRASYAIGDMAVTEARA